MSYNNSKKRGQYNEIILSSLSKRMQTQVKNLFEEACKSEKVDEHGNWTFRADFDHKGRGTSLNWDLYATGKDYHSKRLLIVIQIRQYHKRSRNAFPTIKKSYFLIGRNEDNTAFAHAINSKVIHSAIKKNNDVIKACQNWMFDCDYTKIMRQGDLCLIPIKSKPRSEAMEKTSLLLQESHYLEAKEMRSFNDHLYALNPSLIHQPQTHPDIKGEGWHKVVVAKRGRVHDFAAPTID